MSNDKLCDLQQLHVWEQSLSVQLCQHPDYLDKHASMQLIYELSLWPSLYEQIRLAQLYPAVQI